MVERQNTQQPETKKAAGETADHLEAAVKKGDSQGYATAIDEVNKYRDTHKPEETKAYVAAITKKLEDDHILPAVALFESKEAFKKIDTDGNGRLTKAELDAYANRKDVNGLQSNLITNVENNYNQIRDYNKTFESWYGGNSDAISDTDVNKGVAQQRALNNLFAKNAEGQSLYDRITNKDGNIEPGKLNDLLQLEKDNPGKWLTPEDKETLQVLKDNRSLWQKLAPWADDQKKADIEKLAEKSGTTTTQLEQQKPGTRDVDPKQPVASDEKAVDTKQKERDDKIKEALTIHKGESYSHCAERLLALAGNTDPSGKEIRQLAHELWVADHKRKANGLRSNQVLDLDDAIKHNANLAKIFEVA